MRQMSFLSSLHDLVGKKSQFIIANTLAHHHGLPECVDLCSERQRDHAGAVQGDGALSSHKGLPVAVRANAVDPDGRAAGAFLVLIHAQLHRLRE